MFDVMYNLPEQERGKKFLITDDMVRGEASGMNDAAAA